MTVIKRISFYFHFVFFDCRQTNESNGYRLLEEGGSPGMYRHSSEEDHHVIQLQIQLSREKEEKEEALRRNDALQARNDEQNRTLAAERRAKEEALSRLSEMMSAKLRFNNPNIADLSDSNRPMKLAERFSELYDNEWTDAFDELKDRCQVTDGETVLLDIVMVTFQTCRKIAEDQKMGLQMALRISDTQMQQDLPDGMKQKLHEFWKTVSTNYLTEDIHQCVAVRVRSVVVGRSWGRVLENEAVNQYLVKCVELCWLMAVQDPPVHLSEESPPGRAFFSDLYRAYLTTGPFIARVIWPVMLLHEGGPLLSKGVAEGTKQSIQLNMDP